MTPQNQRTIGWLVVIVGIVALATPRLRSQGGGSAIPQRTFRRLLASRQAARLTSTTIKEQFT